MVIVVENAWAEGLVNRIKEIKDGRKETTIPLYSNFILGFIDYSVVWKCFPELVEIVVFPRQDIEIY